VRSRQTLTPSTRFYAPPPNPGAVQQIAALAKAKSSRDAALLTSLAATPQAVWIQAEAPEDVQAAVRRTVIRATREARVPVLVANNLPYRDCAQYSAGGASDAAAYAAWIDGFAKGIGNERVVVILEPDSLGIIPYNTRVDGSADWCRPTISDAQGQTIPAPAATATDRYALLARAIDSLSRQAPNAAVYLDGTHSGWLPVGEIAYRLARAGVDRTQGFTVNVSNSQPTPDAIRYGTWISKCLAYASFPAGSLGNVDRYRECPSPGYPSGAIGSTDGSSNRSSAERWYADHLGPGASSAAGVPVLAHFVIDTGRNGRGPLNAAVYAARPFNQPPEVIGSLTGGNYCNPPLAGLGLRPTADTGTPLLDAYLWIKVPGESDGSCDIVGGPRAWDYSSYNPWGITGDAQKHFDPLWGMVDPAAGEWFPEHALQLARNANPPLQEGAFAEVAEARGAAAAPTAEPAAGLIAAARLPPHPSNSAEPAPATPPPPSSLVAVGGHTPPPSTRRRSSAARTPALPASLVTPALGGKSSSVPITFDKQNPYQ
jgi:endoglucanase